MTTRPTQRALQAAATTRHIIGLRAEMARLILRAQTEAIWEPLGYPDFEAWIAEVDTRALRTAETPEPPPTARRATPPGEADPNPPLRYARTATP